MSTGTVKWFSDKKGYGFIVPDEGGKEIYVHHAEIKAEDLAYLHSGQKVEYDIIESKIGRIATNVIPVK